MTNHNLQDLKGGSVSRWAIGIAVSLLTLGTGCATAPPQELLDARTAYQRAMSGPAAQLAPVELHKAQLSLQAAEQAFSDEPKGQRARDLAYIAQRKAQTSEVVGLQERENLTRKTAEQNFVKVQAQALDKTQAKLSQVEQVQRQQAGQLDQERMSMAEAQRQNQELQDKLTKLSAVKNVEGRMVITLSGSVLFASNQSDLLPSAETSLAQVADALAAAKNRDISIQGFTDSRGSDSYNLRLSQRRADAVRAYLVAHGIAADKIKAQGRGKENPIADNATVEGRANNRRVEISVAPAPVAEGSPG